MKKRIICLILIIIVAIGGGIGAYILNEANKGPAEIEESEAKYHTTLKETPTDGSLPEDYSSMDNIAFAMWKLANTDEFHTVTTGKSDASIATIQIYNERTVKQDKAIVSTVSAGMVSCGKQKYFLDNKVLLRDADKINGFDTTWKSSEPECISNSAYINRYGWLPFQCTGYIICEDTILNASDLMVNDDGTYTIILDLNPESDYAPFWYRREVLTNAGSSMIPEFKSINIEYKLDANWRILESRIQEEYKVKSMGIEAVSKTDCTEIFTYENIEFNEEEYNFFKQYETLTPIEGEDAIVMEDDVLTMITSSLQNADGSNKNLDLSILIGDTKLEGLASLNISDLNNVIVQAMLNDIYIEYSDAIYIGIGGLKVKATLSDINNISSLFSTSSLENDLSLDVNQIISDLNNAEVIKNADGSEIEVTAKLNILGLELPLYFHFTKIGGIYSIIDAYTDVIISDTLIHIELKESESSIMEVDKSSYQEVSNISFVFDQISNIISSKKVNAVINFGYEDLQIEGTAKIDYNKNLKLKLNLSIQYKALNEEITLYFLNDTLYLEYHDILLKITIEDLLRLLNDYANLEFSSNLDINLDINSIVKTIFSIDYNSLLKEISLNKDRLDVTLGLQQFIESMADIQLSIKNNNGLDVNAVINRFNIYLNLNSSFDEEIEVVDSNYQNLGYLDYIFDNVIGIIDSKKVEVNLTGNYEDIALDVNARVDFTNDVKINLALTIIKDIYSQEIMISYINETIYLDFADQKLKVSIEDLIGILEICGVQISVDTNISVEEIINVILGIDYSKLLKQIILNEESLNLTLDLQQFLEGMQDITLGIENIGNGLGLTLDLFDITGSITTKDFNIEVVDSDYQNLGYLDYIFDNVIGIIDSKRVYVEFSGAKDNLSLAGVAYVDFRDSINACVELEVCYDGLVFPIVVHYLDEFIQNNEVIHQVVLINFKNIYVYLTVGDLINVLPDVNFNVSEFSVESLIDFVLSLDFAKLIENIILTEDNLTLDIHLEQFNLDLKELIDTTKAISLQMSRLDSGLELSIVDLFNLNIKLYNSFDKDITCITDSYINLYDLINDILFVANLIGKESLNIDITGNVLLDINGSKENINLSIILDLILINGKYNVEGNIIVEVLNSQISCSIYVVDEYVYLTILGQTLQLSFDALTELVNGIMGFINIDTEESFNNETLSNVLSSIMFKDSQTIEIDLSSILSSLAMITIELALNTQEEKLEAHIYEGYELFDFVIEVSITDKSEILLPTNGIVEFTKTDIVYMFDRIENLINSIENSNGFTMHLDATIYGITILGDIEITKELDIYANLIAMTNSNQISIGIKYINNKLYLEFNGLKIVFTNEDFEIIIQTIEELLAKYLPVSDESSLDLADIIDSLSFMIIKKEITAESISLSMLLDILSFNDMGLDLVLSDDGIEFNGIVNENIVIHTLKLGYGISEIEEVVDTQYLSVSNLICMFENLEQGVGSTGEFSIDVMGYKILLPYEMQFKLDLIELLKGENAFKAIELELVISSMYYDPITLTIVDGFIFLDSMDTKYKYEIPVYSLKSVFDDISNTESNTDLDVVEMFNTIVKYINGIEFVSNQSSLEILLSTALMDTINSLLVDALGMDILIQDLELTLNNLTATTADFNIFAKVNLMGMDISVQLKADTYAANYVSNLTEEDKNTFILTNDFSSHPFATRVIDIIKMIQGIASLDYSQNGQGFNLNIPLEVDSSLVDTVNVNGSMGVWLDLQGILDGNDLWSSFKFNADINIKAKMPWYLLGVKVNIDIQMFYIGDGFIYLIVDGDAAGIDFSITEMLIDIKGSLTDSIEDSTSKSSSTIVYLNDLLNRIITGFTTSSVDNVTTLTLSPSAVEVVNDLWRTIVDMVNEAIATLDNSTVTDLINSIVNFNMDVTGFEIKYIQANDGSFESLTLTLSGYRHGTYTPTSLPITLTSSGDLSSTHFDSYQETANQDKYVTAKNEIIEARALINALGDFVYEEEFYLKAKEVQAYLDGMSEIALNSYTTTKVQDMITYYEELQLNETKLKEILELYNQSGMENIENEVVIDCYDAYLYFYENNIVLTEEEFEIYLTIYNAIALEELKGFAESIEALEVLDNIDFVSNLDATISYKNILNDLNNEYIALSDSYQSAFKLFYPLQYEKLCLILDEYNTISSHYINEKIYEYTSLGLDVEQAQVKYIEYDFITLETYVIDSYQDLIVWDILKNHIYNNYIMELDREIGKALELGVVSSLVLTIPTLEIKYATYNTYFKAYFTNDMTKLSEKLEPAKIKYVEEIIALDLMTTFKVDTFSANESYANASYHDYYLFETFPISLDLMDDALEAINYYQMGKYIDIEALIDTVDGFDSTYFTTFKMVYYIYNFIQLLNDDTTSKEVIASFALELQDIDKNYYYTYVFEEKKLLGIGLGVYQCKGSTAHSYFELFTQANDGSYAKLIYDKYLAKIS